MGPAGSEKRLRDCRSYSVEIKNLTRSWYIGTRLRVPIPDMAAIDAESELFAP